MRPWFTNHCRPPQNRFREPVAAQIAARPKALQWPEIARLIRRYKVLYRTLVLTINDNEPRGPGFEQDPRAVCEEQFKKDLGDLYRQSELEINQFDTFTVRFCLAELKPTPHAADA